MSRQSDDMDHIHLLPRDDQNFFQYVPNFDAAIFFATVFGLITIATLLQSFWYKAGYMWVLAMGTACMIMNFMN